MSKYKYDKSKLAGLGVGPFLKEVKTRNAHIEAASDEIPTSIYNPNKLAAMLHPHMQQAVVKSVETLSDAKRFVLVPDTQAGTRALAYFRAGQYVTLFQKIGDATLYRPYTICSSPSDALDGDNTSYTLTIKSTPDGYVSKHILENWKEGEKVILSGPLGQFYYQELRDAKNVIAIAGGSGITPFFSMAAAIADGTEDFNLTILYGSRKSEGILLKDELDTISDRSNGRVKIVHVLSDEKKEGFEHGFISADLIKQYTPGEDYSVFVCGPKALYSFAKKEIEALNLKKRRVRFELSGDYKNVAEDAGFPDAAKGREFVLKVHIHGDIHEIKCDSEKPILWALEAAGLNPPSDCRSGECGFCHSRLISGEVYIPPQMDKRRMGDKKFNWIHPCCTFATGDAELEIFPLFNP